MTKMIEFENRCEHRTMALRFARWINERYPWAGARVKGLTVMWTAPQEWLGESVEHEALEVRCPDGSIRS